MPYSEIKFNHGGTYDTATNEYTITNAGNYLIGYSYNKTNNPSSVRLQRYRTGTSGNGHRNIFRQTFSNSSNKTMAAFYIDKFLVGYIIRV